MKHTSCVTSSLVEARHDGRLDERDVASVERHLVTCAECASLAADLVSIRRLAAQRPGAPAPLEHQRGRQRLLRDAARAEASSSRPRMALGIAFAVAVVLAAAFWLRPSSEPRLRAKTGLAAWVSQPRRVTSIRPTEGARFSREAGNESDVVTLTDGSLDIAVRHLANGERFIVKTTDAEVEVRGTRFEAAATEGRLTLVAVHEGKVELRRRGQRTLLAAGEVWRAEAGDMPGDAVASGPASPAEVEPGQPSPASAPPSTVAPVPKPVASRPEGAPAVLAPGAAASSTPPGGESSRAFREAMGRLEQGDYGAASERMDGFLRAHPDDPRAEDAAFLVAVSLQRAGRRAEAAEAARRYLARFPNGYRRAEAQALAAGR